ncbi:hypothetical protein EYZ11_013436 [Aspergillus tanneri]|uniref:Uncharacterized protein n=1 Tax=Aspergillus tanneri TaxID=1220188 RepID=A0A4S3IZT0_9EURO|nr:hypothetical protein EYZ11_013436 [Aspergillus tanneri]
MSPLEDLSTDGPAFMIMTSFGRRQKALTSPPDYRFVARSASP